MEVQSLVAHNVCAPFRDMKLCPLFSGDECQHEFSATEDAPPFGCGGDFVRCYLRVSDAQLSGFINGKILDGEADLTFNRGDIRAVLRVNKDSWLALELARRYGNSHAKKSNTRLFLAGHAFRLSTTAKPLLWEYWSLFCLDLLLE